MRKYLIVALAALVAIAVPAVSAAQEEQGATMEVKVTPKKAGKKGKKAKNSKLFLAIANQDPNRTMSELRITHPKTIKLSTKGLTKCDREMIEDTQSIDGCSKKSFVGTGTANALLGVTTDNPTPLTFDVTAVVTGNKSLDFFLQAREIATEVLATGTIRGRTLTIDVPQTAQQPAPGLWAGLVSLESTLSAKKGKRKLITSTGCKKKEHGFSALLTFVDNGVGEAGTLGARAASACR